LEFPLVVKADADELPGDARVFKQAQVMSAARPMPAPAAVPMALDAAPSSTPPPAETTKNTSGHEVHCPDHGGNVRVAHLQPSAKRPASSSLVELVTSTTLSCRHTAACFRDEVLYHTRRT